jgi:hypothetical protein
MQVALLCRPETCRGTPPDQAADEQVSRHSLASVHHDDAVRVKQNKQLGSHPSSQLTVHVRSTASAGEHSARVSPVDASSSMLFRSGVLSA